MSDHQQLEQQLKDAKELVARRDLAVRLSQNPDFRKLILEDFIRDETVRLVSGAGDPLADEKMQRDMTSMAMAGGHLRRFLSLIVQHGNTAEADIKDIEASLEELRNEGNDD